MLLRSRFATIVLLLFLSACSARPPVLGAATARPGPSSTIPPTQVPVLLTVTPPASPPASPTAAPLPAASPTSAPTPTAASGLVHKVLPAPKPLTGPAPWLMFPCGATSANPAPTVANGDGSGCVPFSLPAEIPADRAWYAFPAQQSSFVAFRVRIQPKPGGGTDQPLNAAYRLQPNGLDDQLWIIKLPENRIVRKITQIDSEGWLRIQEAWKKPSGKLSDGSDFVPLPLAVILDPASYRWSPDGRFLAYTAVDATGVDLFAYDTHTDTIRRMSRTRQGAFFWDWSPDGRWIIYHEMAGCRLETTRCQFRQARLYYATSFPTTEYQFENSFIAETVDWIAKDRFVIWNTPAPGQPSQWLYQVNLATGGVTVLYDQPFYSYMYIPNTFVTKQEMYLLNLPAKQESDRAAGAYRLYPGQVVDPLRPFTTGKYAGYLLDWNRTLERFVLWKNPGAGESSAKEVLLNSISLLDPLPLGSMASSILHPSPDGQWFAAQTQTGSWALYDAKGKQVQELGQGVSTAGNPVTWLRDSSAFYFPVSGKSCASSNGCIYRYAKDQGWKAVLAGELKGAPDNLQVIDPQSTD